MIVLNGKLQEAIALAARRDTDREELLRALVEYLKRSPFEIKSSTPHARGEMLSSAVLSGDARFLRLVHSYGVSLEAKRDGSFVGFNAVRRGDVEMARTLVELGFSGFGAEPGEALLFAVRSHNPAMIRFVFEQCGAYDKLRDGASIRDISSAFFDLTDDDLEKHGVQRCLECIDALRENGVPVDASWFGSIADLFPSAEYSNDYISSDEKREQADARAAAMREMRCAFIEGALDRLSDCVGDDAAMVAKLRGSGVMYGCLVSGMVSRAEWLVNHGMSKYDTMSDGATWIGHAMQKASEAVQSRLDVGWRMALRNGAALGVDVNRRLNSGHTPLTLFMERVVAHRSSITADGEFLPALLDELVQMGFDLNARSIKGETPLQTAARRPEPVLMLLLAERGADVHARSPDGRPPLSAYVAACAKDQPVNRSFADGQLGRKVDGTIVRMVREFGADPNAKSSIGFAALHEDVREIETVSLIEVGADPNLLCDNIGWTPLHYRARAGQQEVAMVLMSHGADVFKPDRDGVTLADEAKEGGLPYNVQNLIMAEVVARTGELQDFVYPDGDRVLHRAAARGEHWALSRMKDVWSDIDVRDANGHSALHVAVMREDTRAVSMLLAMGADVNLPAPNGARPIHMCVSKDYCKEPHLDTLRLLLERGADATARYKGKNVSALRRDPEVTRVLRAAEIGSRIESAFEEKGQGGVTRSEGFVL